MELLLSFRHFILWRLCANCSTAGEHKQTCFPAVFVCHSLLLMLSSLASSSSPSSSPRRGISPFFLSVLILSWPISSPFLSYLFWCLLLFSSSLSSLLQTPWVSVAFERVAPDTWETKSQAASILTTSLPNIKLIPPSSIPVRSTWTQRWWNVWFGCVNKWDTVYI